MLFIYCALLFVFFFCLFVSFLYEDIQFLFAYYSVLYSRLPSLHTLARQLHRDHMLPMNLSFPVPAGHSGTNMLIRGISPLLTDTRLKEEMERFGAVESVKVLRDLETSRSREKCFVLFREHEHAVAAMRALAAEGLQGAAVRVEWAKERYDKIPTGDERLKKRKVFVRNIPNDVTQEELRNVGERYGPVESVDVRPDTRPSNGGEPRQIGFIVYSQDGVAVRASDALDNTAPFRGCGDIPIMAKLAETFEERRDRRPSVSGRNCGGADRGAQTPASGQGVHVDPRVSGRVAKLTSLSPSLYSGSVVSSVLMSHSSYTSVGSANPFHRLGSFGTPMHPIPVGLNSPRPVARAGTPPSVLWSDSMAIRDGELVSGRSLQSIKSVVSYRHNPYSREGITLEYSEA